MKKMNLNGIEPDTEIEVPVDTYQEVTGCTLTKGIIFMHIIYLSKYNSNILV